MRSNPQIERPRQGVHLTSCYWHNPQRVLGLRPGVDTLSLPERNLGPTRSQEEKTGFPFLFRAKEKKCSWF